MDLLIIILKVVYVFISLSGLGLCFDFLLNKIHSYSFKHEKIQLSFLFSVLSGTVLVSSIIFISGLFYSITYFLLIVIFISGILFFILFFLKFCLLKKVVNLLNGFLTFSNFEKILFFVISASVLLNIFSSFYPPHFSDETGYHLSNPIQFFISGNVYGDVLYPYSLFPVSFEMIYLYVIGIFGVENVKLFHCFFYVISLFTIYRVFINKTSKKTVLLSLVIFTLTPLISLYASLAFTTGGIIAYFYSVLYYMEKFIKSGLKKDFIYFILFSSFLLIIHHSGILLIFSIFMAFIIIKGPLNSLSIIKKYFLIITLIFIFISFPYYFRNYIVTKNPFYPLFSSILRISDWNFLVEWNIEKMFYKSKGTGRSFLDLLLLPYNLLIYPEKFSTFNGTIGLGSQYLIFIPFLFLSFFKNNKKYLSYFFIIFICLIFWFFFIPHFIRFMFPILPLICFFFADGIFVFLCSSPLVIFRLIIYVILSGSILLSTYSILQINSFAHFLMFIKSEFNKEKFLESYKGDAYILTKYINETCSDKDSKVGYFSQYISYLSRISAYSFYTSPLLSQIFISDNKNRKEYYNSDIISKEELLMKIKALKIDYLIFNKSEYFNNQTEYFDYILSHYVLILECNDNYVYYIKK